MPNMNVAYRGPDPSLIKLTSELRAHYGNPARTYEYVTGYKDPGNFSGHNADSNGIVHAVDIFTDDHGNIPQPEGRALAERLRQVGAATNRFSYLIHDMSPGAPKPMIAGQFNGWKWQAYGGADMHSDHIHVSIADLYWGDPCPVPASAYNNTAAWNVTGGSITKPQSGTVTPIKPIQKGFLMALTDAEQKLIYDRIKAYTDAPSGTIPAKVVTAVLDEPITRGGGVGGKTSLRSTVAYLDANLAALRSVVEQLAKGQGVTIDYAKIQDAVKSALKDGTVQVDVTVAGAK